MFYSSSLEELNATWLSFPTYWNKGIGGSLPSDRSTAPGMGYTGRRADLTGQTRWARLRKRCANLHTRFIYGLETLLTIQILFISPFVQAILAGGTSTAKPRFYAPRKIVDRKALLRTNDGSFSLPFSSPTFAGLNGRKRAASDVSYVSSSEHDSKANILLAWSCLL